MPRRIGVRQAPTRLGRDMPSQKMSIRKNRTTLASKLTAIVSRMSGPVVNLAHSNEKSSLIYHLSKPRELSPLPENHTKHNHHGEEGHGQFVGVLPPVVRRQRHPCGHHQCP